MADAHLALAKAAGAAWERYRSTVLMGGTPEQRRWAFDVALKAEGKLAEMEMSLAERGRRARSVKALTA